MTINKIRGKVKGGLKPAFNEIEYNEYVALLCNAVIINDLQDNEIDYNVQNLIKHSLIESGRVGYDNLIDKWADVAGEGVNELGNPINLTFITKNGKRWTRPASYEPEENGAFIIKALPSALTFGDIIKKTTDFIEKCDNAIYQNIEAIKTPYIVECKNPDLQLSLKHAIEEKQEGQAVIIVNESLGDGLKSIDIGVNYIADKVEILKNEWRDKLLNKLGIMSANTEKRERVQVGEVNATLGQCTDYIYLLIDTFNKQCDTYNLPFKMALNASLGDLYNLDGENIEDEQNEDVESEKGLNE